MLHAPPMALKTARLLGIAALFLVAACGTAQSHAPAGREARVPSALEGLAVLQTFPLSSAQHGVEGRLELLVDSRLSKARWEQAWATGEDMEGSHSAVLQVVDARGSLRDRRLLMRPLARFEPETLTVPEHPAWLLTVDYSAPAGSYNGPVTTPVRVHEARIQMLEAENARGPSTPIQLMRALKSDWRLEPSRSSPGQDILQVSTSPDPDKPGKFQVLYERLSFEGRHWVRHERRETGFWEADGEFPERALFP